MSRSPLITVTGLAALLAQVHPVTLLDVRWRLGGPSGADEFAQGHVPGACYVDLERDLAGESGARGRHPLPDRARFSAAMRRAGVRHEVPVVVLDDWGGRAAARAWWLLRHHGHSDVRVLDGGWSAWRAAGGAVETGPGLPVAPGDFIAAEGRAVLAVEDVLSVEVLVDARNPERYSGKSEPVDPVAGHIPGAVNVPTAENLAADGTFRSPAELQARFAQVGAVPGAQVAAYCGSGITACHELLALALTGVDAMLYPGSWSEWVTDPSRPVETGPGIGVIG